LVLRRAIQLEVDISGFPNVAAHFKRMQERPSVKKLLAYEKEMKDLPRRPRRVAQTHAVVEEQSLRPAAEERSAAKRREFF
jgi:hypothetical protein